MIKPLTSIVLLYLMSLSMQAQDFDQIPERNLDCVHKSFQEGGEAKERILGGAPSGFSDAISSIINFLGSETGKEFIAEGMQQARSLANQLGTYNVSVNFPDQEDAQADQQTSEEEGYNPDQPLTSQTSFEVSIRNPFNYSLDAENNPEGWKNFLKTVLQLCQSYRGTQSPEACQQTQEFWVKDYQAFIDHNQKPIAELVGNKNSWENSAGLQKAVDDTFDGKNRELYPDAVVRTMLMHRFNPTALSFNHPGRSNDPNWIYNAKGLPVARCITFDQGESTERSYIARVLNPQDREGKILVENIVSHHARPTVDSPTYNQKMIELLDLPAGEDCT